MVTTNQSRPTVSSGTGEEFRRNLVPKAGLSRVRRVLIVEDDKDIVELVRYNLEKEGYQVAAAGDGLGALAQVKKAAPDLVILDLMLPKLSGLEVCREVRRDTALNRLPILMLTARGDEADRVVGLEIGADDYVTKPFSPRELVARVKALLRRAEPPGQTLRAIASVHCRRRRSGVHYRSAGKPKWKSWPNATRIHALEVS